MAKGKAQRLEERRKKGPSQAEGWRGPNTGAWENTYIPLRKDQGFKTGIADWRRDSTNSKKVMTDKDRDWR